MYYLIWQRMASMYERLMNLPIFKGAGEELINDIAETTPLEFMRYEPGEIVVSDNDVCEEVICLMSGSVRLIKKYCFDKIEISEIIGKGNVIGIDHLFGLHKHFGMKVEAIDEVGVMKLSKNHYLRLIQGSKLLLINFLNLVSRHAQNSDDALRSHDLTDANSELSYLIQVSTSPEAQSIEVYTPGKRLADILIPTDNNTLGLLNKLEADGLIIQKDFDKIVIPSRAGLLDAYRREKD